MMRTMRAIVVTELGGPEVLKSQEVPLNWPRGARDVLVRLRAASLNPADIYFRRLGPYVRSHAPLILGHDGAGEIEAVGEGDGLEDSAELVVAIWSLAEHAQIEIDLRQRADAGPPGRRHHLSYCSKENTS